jgi:hypothetical protein
MACRQHASRSPSRPFSPKGGQRAPSYRSGSFHPKGGQRDDAPYRLSSGPFRAWVGLRAVQSSAVGGYHRVLQTQASARERHGRQGDHDPDDDQRDVEDHLSVPGSPGVCGRWPASRPTKVGHQSARPSGGDQYTHKANDEKPVHRRTVHRVRRSATAPSRPRRP